MNRILILLLLALGACHSGSDKRLREEADIALKAGDLDRASQLFLQIIENDPDSAQTHRDLALTYASRGLSELALEQYRAYLALEPDAPDALDVRRRILANK